MPTAQGQPATFQFWNLLPLTTYNVKLTAGATYTGAIFQNSAAFRLVAINQAGLILETAASDDEWLSGSVSVGLTITAEEFSGHANIAAPVVMQVDCLGSVTTQASAFAVDIGFEIPPGCVVCGAGPEAACPDGMQLCLFAHRFFCCPECPDRTH